MRFAVNIAATVTAAVAALVAGCSPSDEPADPAALTTTARPAPPRATTTTTAATSPATSSAATATGATTTPATTTAAAAAPNTSQAISVRATASQITPAPGPVDVKLGNLIAIEVTSDVADELRVQGYERILPLQAGQPGRLVLAANLSGEFQVVLASSQRLLFTLRVA